MLRWAIDATALALILAAVEGCGSSSNSSAPDASTGGDGSADAGTEAGEAGPDCGSTPPSGTQLVKSTDPPVILAMTGDDHVVYEDLTTQEIYGVATAGGKPSDIGKMLSQATAVWSRNAPIVKPNR